MKNPWFLPAAALAVGAIGGYISGKNTSPASDAEATENAARWMRESPEAARAYVEQSTSFSDGAKDRVLEGSSLWSGRGHR